MTRLWRKLQMGADGSALHLATDRASCKPDGRFDNITNHLNNALDCGGCQHRRFDGNQT
jgi:hypothetical protein